MTSVTCLMALSLCIVAGCAGVDRQPTPARPSHGEAATLERAEVAAADEAPAPQAPPAVAPKAETPKAAPTVAKSAAPAVPAKPPAPATTAPKPAAAPKQTARALAAPSASTGSSSSGSTAATSQPARNATAAAPNTMDLSALEQRLKDTDAIGVMTKITLKNQVDELLARFKAHHEGRDSSSLEQLRQPYDTLILKVLSLLQDKDPSLASSIAQSREAIWSVLIDRNRFTSL